MKKNAPKSCGHKTVPLDHFQSYKIILESVDTILYPHTNLYPTLPPFSMVYNMLYQWFHRYKIMVPTSYQLPTT